MDDEHDCEECGLDCDCGCPEDCEWCSECWDLYDDDYDEWY